MKINLFIRIFICILTMVSFLYSYISQQNKITLLRMQIPLKQKELQKIEQINTRLQFDIDAFENPLHLMQMAREEKFQHLKYPLSNEIITVYVDSRLSCK